MLRIHKDEEHRLSWGARIFSCVFGSTSKASEEIVPWMILDASAKNSAHRRESIDSSPRRTYFFLPQDVDIVVGPNPSQATLGARCEAVGDPTVITLLTRQSGIS